MVNVDENVCKLLVEFDTDFNMFFLSGIVDARAKSVLDELPHRIEHRRITFDFGGVTRINSMGIALLLRCFKQIRDEMQAEVRLSHLSPVNAMLFKITGIFLLATPDEEPDQQHLQ